MNVPMGRQSEASLFENSIKSGKLAQAYIISAPEGMGKRTFLKYVLSLVMCSSHSSCGSCPSCRSLAANAHPDVYEMRRPQDRASVGIDAVRSMLAQVYARPTEADFKAVIVYEAHLLTAEAQNAMLKIIEEPPANVVFFLLCNTTAPILTTVMSRCVLVELKPLSRENLRAICPDAGEFELGYCGGNPGVLKKLLSDGSFSSLRDELTEKICAITSDDAYTVYRAAEFLDKNKDSRDEMINIILFFIRDALFKKLGMTDCILNKDKLQQIEAFSRRCGTKECCEALYCVLEVIRDRGKNGNFSIAAINMLFKCREVLNGRSYGNTL